MPAHAPNGSTEKDLLIGYLVQQQDAFRAAAFGLTDDQAGQRTTPSALTVGSLVKHAAGAQRGWTARIAASPGRPVDPRTLEERMAAYQAEHEWQDADRLPQALESFDAACSETLEVIRSADLDGPVPVPGDAPWYPQDVEAWTVRWVVLHLIEELARHAGHADIIREGIDGATMYELKAGYEGWPKTPWLTPWTPAAT